MSMKPTRGVTNGVLILGLGALLTTGGCMSIEKEREIDTRYDALIGRCREANHGAPWCGTQYEYARNGTKAYYNSFWSQVGRYVGQWPMGKPGGTTTYVYILNK